MKALHSGREGRAPEVLSVTAHRPWPLPIARWAIHMQWTHLLFAHWPVPVQQLAPLIPPGLAVDMFDGAAWVGVVPFRMESVQLHGLPRIPGAHLFAEANVRTYVRDRRTGAPGVYFFSLDANNPLAVLGARLWYHLPYYFARMNMQQEDGSWWNYRSRRLFSRRPALLDVRYRPTGPAHPRSQPGTVESFLTERYALFASFRRRLIRVDIHHLPWTLQSAEAEFQRESLSAAQGILLPPGKPLLHFSALLDVYAWAPKLVA